MRLLHRAIFITLFAWASVALHATIQPTQFLMASLPDWGNATSSTANATGESAGVIGQVRIAGNGTSKTISAAGSGKILWITGSVTWATAGSTFRIGIQDVDTATGLEDGTFDVYKEYVQGTDTITASTSITATMSSGTKTLSDGDLIAIVGDFTTRNGADSVQLSMTGTGISQTNANLGFPYGSIDTGTLVKSNTTYLQAFIQFDDGTYGWIRGTAVARGAATSQAFNSGSTPDEYCGTFVPAYKMQISGIGTLITNIASTDNYEMILYTDPYGTPAATVTVTPDPDVDGAASAGISGHIFHITPTTLTAGITYGVAVRPTTANNISYAYRDEGSSSAADFYRAALPLGQIKVASRTNQTGAFSVVSDNYLPSIFLDVSGLDDGLGGASEHAYPFAKFVAPRLLRTGW